MGSALVSWSLALVMLLHNVIENACDGFPGSDLCTQCPGSVRNGSLVQLECGNGELEERCCVKSECSDCGDIVIGLDWSRCNLTELDDYAFSDVGTTLQILDVSDNELTNDSISSRAFGGLVNLMTLVLPPGMECSPDVWNSSSETTNSTICYHPLSPCEEPPDNSTADEVVWDNVTDATATDICPPNSHCVPDGPGLHQCLCSEGYHGYKCLLQGTFPYAAFFGGSVGGTVVTVAIYWSLRWSEKLFRRRRVFNVTSN